MKAKCENTNVGGRPPTIRGEAEAEAAAPTGACEEGVERVSGVDVVGHVQGVAAARVGSVSVLAVSSPRLGPEPGAARCPAN